ncbi:methyltransferase domain-containing protein [Allorhodopirellula solitaria]|uniref:Uncharacterized protein n=1 Tax=Allorhodopirellula solitaria TaxID=2527987 RepID=A0A5C5XPR9_9BACT|nr:class I SAM-dependent methyltransferase [Allorhodopirellula solitaria]TWT64678.1 hypothetical protein CA85_38110 [Allorhodopirellula solitaria]
MKTHDPVTQLDFNAIDWSPHSFEDPGGRLFWKDDRVFRALRGESAEAFCRLEDAGLLDEMPQWNVVKTWRSDLQIDGYDLVVEHEKLPPSPLVSEWSPAMLRDAALLFCDLTERLAGQDLQLQDSHGWNMMFDNATLRYIDFSSIIPLADGEPWKPLNEFLNCFLHPLQLIDAHAAEYAFFLLGRDNWVPLEATIPRWTSLQFEWTRRRKQRECAKLFAINDRGGPDAAIELARSLKRKIEKCSLPRPQTRWSDYAGSFPKSGADPQADWNEKQRSVAKILNSLSGGTVLDVGCNTGWYSILAAQLGLKTISMDTDRTCIDALYRYTREHQLAITPVVGSFFSPAIAHGPRFYDPLEKRFQADHTLMLALAHHLFFKQGYEVSTIVEVAASVTRKTLVLEHVPSDDYWIEQWNVPHRQADYAIEVWREALQRFFTNIESYPSERSHESSDVQRTILVATR